MLPSSVDEKPHWGLMQRLRSGTYSGRLFNAMLQIARVFQGAVFGGNQAEDHLLICNMVQWSEIARAF